MLPSAHAQSAPRTNWAGNYTYTAPNLIEAATPEDVQTAVRTCHHLRALGSRHSFNSIADDPETQVSLHAFRSIDIDSAARTATVGAGIRYGDLAPVIDARGFALHNLASLPHISVAGAIATATHGSGLHNGNLATQASAIEFIDAHASTVRLTRSDPQFQGAAVHLGAIGILTRVTLDLQPTYQVAQTVYLDLPFARLEHHIEDIFLSGYSVSLFTDWQNSRATQVWIKRRVGDTYNPATLGPDFYGAHPATENMHPITGHSAEACTEQMGVPGPWYARLPHFKMNFTPSSGQELQTEYLIPFEHAYPAIRAVETLRDQITPHLYVTELRTIAADDLWMSTACRRRSLAIHFTWKPEWPAVRTILPQIEVKLRPFSPRPHWGKLFSIPPDRIDALYPRLADFKSLVSRYDPNGKFRNQFIDRNLYAGEKSDRTDAD
jgi:xylitol oxidase